jgi:hypothetical protein
MFSEEITWILTEFKGGSINFSEAIYKIEVLYARRLGLCHPLDVQKELDRHFNQRTEQ